MERQYLRNDAADALATFRKRRDEMLAHLRSLSSEQWQRGGRTMRVIGHPGRAVGLERLLDYMQKHDGVWITKRVEIARHWIKTHPYPGKGLNERARSASHLSS